MGRHARVLGRSRAFRISLAIVSLVWLGAQAASADEKAARAFLAFASKDWASSDDAATTRPAEPEEADEYESDEDKPLTFRLPIGPAFQDEGLVHLLDGSNPMVDVAGGYRLTHFSRRHIKRQSSNLSMTQQDFGTRLPCLGGFPLWLSGLKYRRIDFAGSAVLPDTRDKFPNRLQNIQVSGRFGHAFPWGSLIS